MIVFVFVLVVVRVRESTAISRDPSLARLRAAHAHDYEDRFAEYEHENQHVDGLCGRSARPNSPRADSCLGTAGRAVTPSCNVDAKVVGKGNARCSVLLNAPNDSEASEIPRTS